MAEFQPGYRIPTISGEELEIIEKLGEGGQGTVYKVRYGGRQLALKWYFPGKLHDAVKFYKNLENNIKKGAPTGAFLWPIELTHKVGGSFGYLMELRPPEYKDFSQFLLARVHLSGIDALINAALCITNAFRELHAKGYSYQDLNDGNFFINPRTGDVLICDNDNVAPYGESLGIAGKCRYMAPEIVTHQSRPDLFTDRFSLGVVLYMLLFLNHPLEGQRTLCPCMTEELEYKFFGAEPIFVYDEKDDSNRPVPRVHVNELKLWKFYPEFIRDMFRRAFAKDAMVGENAKQNRPTDKEWEELFIRLKNTSVRCSSCQEVTFVDLDSTGKHLCVNCGQPVKRMPILKVKKHTVILGQSKKLYECHTTEFGTDYREPTAEIITSVSNPGVIGLKNLTDSVWNVTNAEGDTRQFEKGKTVKLVPGLQIQFNNETSGEIV